MAQMMANSFSLRVLRNDGSRDGDGQKHMHPQSPLKHGEAPPAHKNN